MDINLHALATSPALPEVGQVALAEHGDLHRALADNPALADAAFCALYRRRRLPEPETALALVARPLEDHLVRHVLDAGEDRPAIIGALAAANAPTDAELRARILAFEGPEVSEGVLANDAWTTTEQAAIAAWGSGATLLQWLAGLDPATDGEVVDATLGAWPTQGAEAHGTKLHAGAIVALRAAVRWPQLLEVPRELIGPSLRSVAATFSRDPRVLHRLLDEATELGRGGWIVATALVEAVAVNPYASGRVQRRAARISRTVVSCAYLEDWRPAPAAGPRRDLGSDERAGVVLDALERNVNSRHRTVWSAVQLAFTEDVLAPDDVERIVRYLTLHGRAAGLDRGTAALALGRHTVAAADLEACLDALWTEADPPRVRGAERVQRGVVDIEDGQRQQADRHARALGRRLGDSLEAWSLAVVLLRDGWDRSVAELATVVSQLVITEGSAA